ncbi:hypothetical protein [Clostridium sp. Marseille-P2415]|uniref:hypothetical protein n=1 Tax=Clostridium sp. Marseille-P2415 TaxID=1805471 RepID=UPI0009883D25|nr:hypothetical protein [Clostridium sp. Marseille-P2415]
MREEQMKDMLSELIQLPDEVFARFAFSYELLRNKISPVKQEELIYRASECGTACADEIIHELGLNNGNAKLPEEIAKAFSLTVEYKKNGRFGERFTFAYFEPPKRITLFYEYLQNAEEYLKKLELPKALTGLHVSGVILAHEIFHFLEEEYADEIFTRQYKIDLWAPRPFRNRSTVRCLGEIAAMAFAKRLTGMSCSPFIFDALIACSIEPGFGVQLYEEVMKFNTPLIKA